MNFKKYLESFLNLPLRNKFILSVLVVICLGGVIILFLGTRLEHNTIFSLAQAKVRHDLANRAYLKVIPTPKALLPLGN